MLPYYYSVSEYLKDTYGKKLYKLSLSGNMTCPNRDGKLGTTGCIFCSGHGSGDFAVKDIDKAKTLISSVNIPAVNILHTFIHLLTHMLMPDICVNFLCL